MQSPAVVTKTIGCSRKAHFFKRLFAKKRNFFKGLFRRNAFFSNDFFCQAHFLRKNGRKNPQKRTFPGIVVSEYLALSQITISAWRTEVRDVLL